MIAYRPSLALLSLHMPKTPDNVKRYRYYKRLPKKVVSAGVLLFNNRQELLILNTTSYKDHWEIPGGIVEADESPRQACLREIKEETGLSLKQARLLVIDYKMLRDRITDSFQMIFYGGTLTRKKIQQIRLPKSEASDFKFLPPNRAAKLLGSSVGERILWATKALKNKQVLYL